MCAPAHLVFPETACLDRALNYRCSAVPHRFVRATSIFYVSLWFHWMIPKTETFRSLPEYGKCLSTSTGSPRMAVLDSFQDRNQTRFLKEINVSTTAGLSSWKVDWVKNPLPQIRALELCRSKSLMFFLCLQAVQSVALSRGQMQLLSSQLVCALRRLSWPISLRSRK